MVNSTNFSCPGALQDQCEQYRGFCACGQRRPRLARGGANHFRRFWRDRLPSRSSI